MKYFLFFLSCVITINSYSQTDSAQATEAEKNWSVGLDITAPYMWRGQRYNSPNKMAFQPYASYTFADKLTIGVWASSNLDDTPDSYQEFDWNIKYQINDYVAIQIADYYFPATKSGGGAGKYHYFDYDYGSPHTVDGTILLNYGNFDFQWNTMIYGNDFKNIVEDDDGNVISKKRAYSSYAELGYTHSFGETGLSIRPCVGVALLNDEGYYGYDEDGDAGVNFCNVGAKLIWEAPFSENWTLPIWFNYGYNQFGLANLNGEIKHHLFSFGMSFVY